MEERRRGQVRRRGRPSAAASVGPAAQESVRRALIGMTLGLAVAFPALRPPGTSDAVTGISMVLALGVALGLWRRLAHPLTLLRLGTLGGLAVMTWGIVTAASGGVGTTPLGLRFLAYAAIAMILALFVLGTRRGVVLAAAVLVVWTLIVARLGPAAALRPPDGEVFAALRYAVVLLVMLWGVLRAHDVLRAERDVLASQARADRARQRELIEEEQGRARMMAEAAHELRAPLATIGAGADTLDQYGDELDPAAHRQVLTAIQHAAMRLDRRTLELLEAARARVHNIPANRQDVDAADVVTTTMADLAPLTASHIVQLDLARPAPARLDPDGVDHILTNLVHNAVKYSPAGSAIDVRLRREGTTTVLVVADHGPGVPDGVRHELFTPWERDASHADVDGTGVGLAVARTWARRHGGDVVLLDTSGGAAFEVRLPDDA